MLDEHDAGLLIIDVQGKLARMMHTPSLYKDGTQASFDADQKVVLSSPYRQEGND